MSSYRNLTHISYEGSSQGAEETPEEPLPPPTTTGPIDPLVFFSVGTTRTQLANGPALTWNGCDQSAVIRGGYDSDSTCGKAYLHPSFVDHLNKHFFHVLKKRHLTQIFHAPKVCLFAI